MDKGYENNRARMAGTIVGDVRLDHTLYGEAFYSMHLSIPRLSGVMDVLPLIVPGKAVQSDAHGRRSHRDGGAGALL